MHIKFYLLIALLLLSCEDLGETTSYAKQIDRSLPSTGVSATTVSSSTILGSDAYPNPFHADDDGRTGEVGSIYVYYNPHTGDTEYFKLLKSPYQNFPTNKESNTWWKYLGTKPIPKYYDPEYPKLVLADDDWSRTKSTASAPIGAIYVHNNTAMNKMEYYQRLSHVVTAEPGGRKHSTSWRYLGDAREPTTYTPDALKNVKVWSRHNGVAIGALYRYPISISDESSPGKVGSLTGRMAFFKVLKLTIDAPSKDNDHWQYLGYQSLISLFLRKIPGPLVRDDMLEPIEYYGADAKNRYRSQLMAMYQDNPRLFIDQLRYLTKSEKMQLVMLLVGNAYNEIIFSRLKLAHTRFQQARRTINTIYGDYTGVGKTVKNNRMFHAIGDFNPLNGQGDKWSTQYVARTITPFFSNPAWKSTKRNLLNNVYDTTTSDEFMDSYQEALSEVIELTLSIRTLFYVYEDRTFSSTKNRAEGLLESLGRMVRQHKFRFATQLGNLEISELKRLFDDTKPAWSSPSKDRSERSLQYVEAAATAILAHIVQKNLMSKNLQDSIITAASESELRTTNESIIGPPESGFRINMTGKGYLGGALVNSLDTLNNLAASPTTEVSKVAAAAGHALWHLVQVIIYYDEYLDQALVDSPLLDGFIIAGKEFLGIRTAADFASLMTKELSYSKAALSVYNLITDLDKVTQLAEAIANSQILDSGTLELTANGLKSGLINQEHFRNFAENPDDIYFPRQTKASGTRQTKASGNGKLRRRSVDPAHGSSTVSTVGGSTVGGSTVGGSTVGGSTVGGSTVPPYNLTTITTNPLDGFNDQFAAFINAMAIFQVGLGFGNLDLNLFKDTISLGNRYRIQVNVFPGRTQTLRGTDTPMLFKRIQIYLHTEISYGFNFLDMLKKSFRYKQMNILATAGGVFIRNHGLDIPLTFDTDKNRWVVYEPAVDYLEEIVVRPFEAGLGINVNNFYSAGEKLLSQTVAKEEGQKMKKFIMNLDSKGSGGIEFGWHFSWFFENPNAGYAAGLNIAIGTISHALGGFAAHFLKTSRARTLFVGDITSGITHALTLLLLSSDKDNSLHPDRISGWAGVTLGFDNFFSMGQGILDSRGVNFLPVMDERMRKYFSGTDDKALKDLTIQYAKNRLTNSNRFVDNTVNFDGVVALFRINIVNGYNIYPMAGEPVDSDVD